MLLYAAIEMRVFFQVFVLTLERHRIFNKILGPQTSLCALHMFALCTTLILRGRVWQVENVVVNCSDLVFGGVQRS